MICPPRTASLPICRFRSERSDDSRSGVFCATKTVGCSGSSYSHPDDRTRKKRANTDTSGVRRDMEPRRIRFPGSPDTGIFRTFVISANPRGGRDQDCFLSPESMRYNVSVAQTLWTALQDEPPGNLQKSGGHDRGHPILTSSGTGLFRRNAHPTVRRHDRVPDAFRPYRRAPVPCPERRTRDKSSARQVGMVSKTVPTPKHGVLKREPSNPGNRGRIALRKRRRARNPIRPPTGENTTGNTLSDQRATLDR